MQTLSLLILFFLGIFSLYAGAEALVRGSVRLSRQMGISPLIVGLTIVSFGTSAPEFVASLYAALHHGNDIAIGNIIGSNVANIGLIIGICALMKPMIVSRQMLFRQAPILILSSILILLFFYNLVFSVFEGIVLLFFMVVFLISIIYLARKEKSINGKLVTTEEQAFDKVTPEYPFSFLKIIHEKLINSKSYTLNIILVGFGILLLAIGAKWLVDSATKIAYMLGISDVVIGISIIAVGTSLPELATSIVSAIKKEADISVGNVVGSNIFNTFFVLGFVGTVNPVPIYRQIAFQLVPIMVAFTVIFTVIMWTQKKINRSEAAFLFVGYIGFLVYSYYLNPS